VEAKTGNVKPSIKLPGAVHGFKIDEQAGKIYAVLTKESLIGVIDIATNEVTAKWPLTLSDAGSPIAQDVEHHLLFVGCPKTKPMVIAFDSKTGKEAESLAIPAGIDDIHFDVQRQRIYASCSDQALVVIERVDGKLQIVEKIATPKDSRTCLWAQGRLYLGVPKQDGKDGPEIRIYEPRPTNVARANAK
jgi:hypothetical protein